MATSAKRIFTNSATLALTTANIIASGGWNRCIWRRLQRNIQLRRNRPISGTGFSTKGRIEGLIKQSSPVCLSHYSLPHIIAFGYHRSVALNLTAFQIGRPSFLLLRQ
jgi:hypothetical protein